MPQHNLHTTRFISSLDGTFSEIKVSVVRNRVALNLQTQVYDTSGRPHKHHAKADLPLDDAIALHQAIGQAIVVAYDTQPSQPGLWSEATVRAVAHRIGRRAV